ncbi:Predicted DNA-binding transcriptional regulator YafY, contains an HTH and WYL domains [Pseudonocardia thermophila]|jgi:Predicted transcriptional regulator|uniref:Predicted DNA-binding transcriptional regulator YafY, contains an HTH and WYL domains n=1 Tax=Pseudonocardia thermophila TaxID=1848 RepID=A0A1M6QEK9_PSETH|nr:YafY family protein [Pseudonocardia thermophila]SHK18699.1 Predicted DNA-binding transcriptional regulator YafY, contains an HTH and WYL domains [Pseudonocardia thermophila]
MRAARLMTLLFTLQRLRSATAGELARELGVSERTVYRDIAALTEAGVPVWTEPGRGGGIRLVDGWRTRLDGMTAQEAAALFAVGATQALAELGMSSALAAAQAKLLATLPPELRDHARTVAERFHLDAPGWFHGPRAAPALSTVAEAVWEQQRLRIEYRRGSGPDGDAVVERRIEPLGLVVKAGTWYVVARSVGRGDPARAPILTYRVDRIIAAEGTGEAFDRPEGFDLAEHWAESAARFEAQMLRDTVRLRLGPSGLRWLGHVTDPDAAARAIATAGPPDADGWREVELAVENIEIAAHQLVGLADQVEALDPPELRAALAAYGEALVARNSGPR